VHSSGLYTDITHSLIPTRNMPIASPQIKNHKSLILVRKSAFYAFRFNAFSMCSWPAFHQTFLSEMPTQ
jgi:hypothetical protein